MDILLLTVGQIAVALIMVITFALLVLIVRETLGLNKSPVEHMYDFDEDIAEVRRPGAWQYDHLFFDKVTEFRNDFS